MWRCAQNCEVLLPIPAYMDMYFAVISGAGYIGGDSAIVPEQEEAGLYELGQGTFDHTNRAGRVVGSRVFNNLVGNIIVDGRRKGGYGGFGTTLALHHYYFGCVMGGIALSGLGGGSLGGV